MTTKQRVRVGLVVPHIFIHRLIQPGVIFSPGQLALELCEGLAKEGVDVTLFSSGPTDTSVPNITADLTNFEAELAGRGDSYLDLLKKHPFTFISLARQVQAEIIARAYTAAASGELDIVHIYTNEEDIALPFARLCPKPVVFTHHDPFNFLVRYKNVFPKYKDLPWISLSYAQRRSMPADTNWAANIYHGLDEDRFRLNQQPHGDYVAYMGRIIEPKGVHIAVEAVKCYNLAAKKPLKLKIAGKHYAEHTKDAYWQTKIEPELDDTIEYVGHIKSSQEKQDFLGNARALLVPSTFDEPFGMVTIEALACGTPVIGLDRGATPEIIMDSVSGYVQPYTNDTAAADSIAKALGKVGEISRQACRDVFEERFTLRRMAHEHAELYKKLALQND
jgi:glycosyltransferase involved in cell wall biosynthesis